MLQELGAQKKAAQMLQRQDVYGQGLRDMLQVERQRSIMGVLQSLRAKQIGAIVQS
jgi:hypothetical protein